MHHVMRMNESCDIYKWVSTPVAHQETCPRKAHAKGSPQGHPPKDPHKAPTRSPSHEGGCRPPAIAIVSALVRGIAVVTSTSKLGGPTKRCSFWQSPRPCARVCVCVCVWVYIVDVCVCVCVGVCICTVNECV